MERDKREVAIEMARRSLGLHTEVLLEQLRVHVTHVEAKRMVERFSSTAVVEELADAMLDIYTGDELEAIDAFAKSTHGASANAKQPMISRAAHSIGERIGKEIAEEILGKGNG